MPIPELTLLSPRGGPRGSDQSRGRRVQSSGRSRTVFPGVFGLRSRQVQSENQNPAHVAALRKADVPHLGPFSRGWTRRRVGRKDLSLSFELSDPGRAASDRSLVT